MMVWYREYAGLQWITKEVTSDFRSESMSEGDTELRSE